MYSELLKIGPVVIRAYGVMLFISFLLGLLYVYARAKSRGINPDFTINLSFAVIFSAILGARLTYVAYHWSEFAAHPLDIINPFGSSGIIGIAGLNLYGGFIIAVIVGMIYIKKKGEPFWKTADLFAPAIALGIFFTRIGCFLNGCCFGKECSLPWAVHFPEGSIPYAIFGNQGLHPTQLYSSLYGLILFMLLHYLDRRPHFAGMLFSLFLIVEAFFRFIIEFVRYYEEAMFVKIFALEFTFNHVAALGLFIAGWVLFYVLRRRGRRISA